MRSIFIIENKSVNGIMVKPGFQNTRRNETIIINIRIGTRHPKGASLGHNSSPHMDFLTSFAVSLSSWNVFLN